LYEVEVGDGDVREVMPRVLDEADLSEDLTVYAARLVEFFRQHRNQIDKDLASHVKEYDYERLAAIDRNILRMAATEVFFIPEMPPAVTINEAIEISKEYSSAESGRFINGVLSKLLTTSKKSNWDPSTAPVESVVRAKKPAPAPETVEDTSDEAKRVKQFGWIVKSDDPN
jgi:transcription antitermination factor NusB